MASLSKLCNNATAFCRSRGRSYGGRLGLTNKSSCVRNWLLMIAASGAFRSRRTLYETIDQVPNFFEPAQRKSRSGHDFEGSTLAKHPIRNLIRSASRLPNQQMMDTIMFVITDYEHGLTSQWMKRIGDDSFVAQKPGIMSPVRIKEQRIGLASRRSLKPVN